MTGRFKVTKFPTILVVKPGQKKPIKFEGKFTDIREIFEFLNKYQETFALENNAADEELALKKPWLSEAVPELTSISAQVQTHKHRHRHRESDRERERESPNSPPSPRRISATARTRGVLWSRVSVAPMASLRRGCLTL